MKLSRLGWLILGLPFTAMMVAQAPGAVVDIDSGRLQGSEPAPGVRAFLGIPYAQPPLGELRWQPPQPVAHWTGVRTALEHGSPCPQQDAGWNKRDAALGAEDCLHLNVWAPAKGGNYAVMVYLHGGSNVAGSAAEGLNTGVAMVAHGVVLVTVDYRLGIFGFLRSPELDAESPRHTSGDYGLMDQIAALEWVRRNIAAFGGDPAKVMLFGQSAGSVDTGLLMASPRARGLFSRALEESGQVAGLMPTATKVESEQAWAPVVKQLGGTLAAMRAAPLAEVMRADADAPKPPAEAFWGHRGASIDGWTLTELPAKTFADGREAPVPLVIGVNVQEIVPRGMSASWLDHLMTANVGADDAKKLEAIYAAPGADPLLGDMGARYLTDRDFRCPAVQVAAWHASHGFPTYAYQFDRPDPGQKTARHSSELMYVFGYLPESATADDKAMGEAMESYWTTFAKTGSPAGGPDAPAWPRYSDASRKYLEFPAVSAQVKVGNDLGGAACRVLRGDALAGTH
jgi:para-nitrobenzyl esterase